MLLWPSTPQFERARRRAEAAQFQRVRQQGRGRPIISEWHNGKRWVVVGGYRYLGDWKTFEDFLLSYVRTIFGQSWGQSQLLLPETDQHPFMRWLSALAVLHSRHAEGDGEVFSTPSYGAVTALTSLAYDIYTIQHNSKGEQCKRSLERLMRRLRIPNEFYGARHECRAAGLLLRAGFLLEWEDEEDRSGRHGEFHAVWPATGRRFWVECRMRQPEKQGGTFNITRLVSDALRKSATAERLLFVELNASRVLDRDTGGWAPAAVTQLRALEQQPTATSLPPAEIFLTNFAGHSMLEEVVPTAEVVLESFKTDRYRLGREEDLWQAIRTRDAHPELQAIWKSTHHLFAVPSTFDGSLPGVEESTRLLIGEAYEMADGMIGVLEDAIVDESSQKATGIVRRPDGDAHIVSFDLSDAEVQAWRHHPETFFGEVRPHFPPVQDALDMFEFFEASLVEVSREALLQQMKHWPNQSQLQEMPREELIRQRAYSLTAGALHQAPLSEPPQWMRRIRAKR